MVSTHSRGETSPSTTTFLGLGLSQYLDADSRATFAFTLSSLSTDGSLGLNVVYTNNAFQQISSPLSISLLGAPSDGQSAAFVQWAQNTPDGASYEYSDHSWTTVTVCEEWKVVSGVSLYQNPHDSFKNPALAVNGRHVENTAGVGNQSKATPQATSIFDLMRRCGTISLEYCDLLQGVDWDKTPLGPMATWPDSLLKAIPYILCNPGGSCIFWGKERTILYNEPYTKVIQNLHPGAIGSQAKDVFGSIWPAFESLSLDVERTKRPVRHEATRVLLNRSGVLEESFFDYNWMPILDAHGHVRGILNSVVEATKQVVAQRQLNALIKLGEGTGSATSLGDFWDGVFASVQDCQDDLPFAVIYSLDNDVLISERTGTRGSTSSGIDTWYRVGSIGFPDRHPAMRDVLDASSNEGLGLALRAAVGASNPVLISKNDGILSDRMFDGCVDRGIGSEFSQLVVCPLYLLPEVPAAFLVLGVNPLRPYDEEYRRFVNILHRQVEDTAKSVLLLQKEKRHLERTVEMGEYQRQWLSEQLLQQTKEARESELRFYNFAKQAPVGVYILGSEGEIKFCNDAWYHLVGVPSGFKGPVPWRVRAHPDDLVEVDRQWKLLVQGQTQSNFEWRALRSPRTGDDSKDIIYLRSSCFPELDDNGIMKTVTGVLMDVSVHKAHERSAAERLASALEAKRAQENFMDMVSHEMRNPLNAILQCAGEAAQLLRLFATTQKASHSEELAGVTDILEAIDTIQYCGRHQKQIIDDVLTISKLDSNLLTLSPTDTVPVSVVDQVAKIFASEIRAADITISRKTTPEGAYKPYLMDRNRVLQVLINLVGNAIKFLKDRPVRKLVLSIVTSTTRPESTEVKYVSSGKQRKNSNTLVNWGTGEPVYIYFSVRDTGPGLSTEEMESLFARFQQASPRTHAQYGGSGLGLFISRELAELHGGEIGLASEVDKGSTFAFYVEGHAIVADPSKPPQTDGSPITHEGHAITRSPPRNFNSVTATAQSLVEERELAAAEIAVLIVEDNVVNQKVLQRQLRRLGYQTATANHGQEALDHIEHSQWCVANAGQKADKFSIVLCDLEMPVMDGMTFVRHVRQRQHDGVFSGHIPMIAVTGNARAEQVNAAREAGFDDVVCKPYSVPDLVPLVHRLVEA